MKTLPLDYLTDRPLKAYELQPISFFNLCGGRVHVEKVLFDMIFPASLLKLLVNPRILRLHLLGIDPAYHALFGLSCCLVLHLVDRTDSVLLFQLVQVLGHSLDGYVVVVLGSVVAIELQKEGLLLKVGRKHR